MASLRDRIGRAVAAVIRTGAVLVALAMPVGAIEVEPLPPLRDGASAPTAVIAERDRLVVLDPFNRRLRFYTPQGVRQHQVDISGWATGLARLADGVYVFCDRQARRIVRVDVNGGVQETLVIQGGPIADPVDVAVVGGRLYVLDGSSGRLWICSPAGVVRDIVELVDDRGTRISFASSLAVDVTAGRVYVLDQVGSSVWVFSASGRYLDRFGGFGDDEARITRGGALACDRFGHLFVSDRFQGRVLVYDSTGGYLGAIGPSRGGLPPKALPIGLTVDPAGVLYVATAEGQAVYPYYVGFEGVQAAPPVELIFPAFADTVASSGVELAVRFVPPDDSLSLYVTEFELYDDTGATPVQTAVVAAGAALPDQDTRAVLVRWRPERPLRDETCYRWRARTRRGDLPGAWSALSEFVTAALPQAYRLGQNYPNPFNPETRITFEVPVTTRVQLTIISLLGRPVVTLFDEVVPAGEHTVVWDVRDADG